MKKRMRCRFLAASCCVALTLAYGIAISCAVALDRKLTGDPSAFVLVAIFGVPIVMVSSTLCLAIAFCRSANEWLLVSKDESQAQ